MNDRIPHAIEGAHGARCGALAIVKRPAALLASLRKYTWWAEKDLHLRRHKPPDLQSGPFDYFGIDPVRKRRQKERRQPILREKSGRLNPSGVRSQHVQTVVQSQTVRLWLDPLQLGRMARHPDLRRFGGSAGRFASLARPRHVECHRHALYASVVRWTRDAAHPHLQHKG